MILTLTKRLKNKVLDFVKHFTRVPYCTPAWGWNELWAIIKCLIMGQVLEGKHKERLYRRHQGSRLEVAAIATNWPRHNNGCLDLSLQRHAM